MANYKRLLVLCAALFFCISASAAHGTKMTTKKVAKTNVAVTVVNINTAGVKTLKKVKGIGYRKAQAIVRYRKKHGNFKTINDLTKVKGFTKDSVKNLKGKITV